MESSAHLVEWTAVVAGFVGVLVGAAIPLAWQHRKRARELEGKLDAIHVEFRRAIDCMTALRRENILAPLYRVPTALTARALPELIGEGWLELNEMGAVVEWLNRCEELNRGLARAGDAHAAGRDDWLQQEFKRNCAKAEAALEKQLERFGGMSVADAAQSAVFAVQKRRGISKA